MKRPFQVGDRVSFEGYSATGKWWHGRGRITRADDIYSISIDVDGNQHTIVMPIRTLRRLVPKKRREVWLQFDSIGIVYNSAKEQPKHQSSSWTRFIEARPKRKPT